MIEGDFPLPAEFLLYFLRRSDDLLIFIGADQGRTGFCTDPNADLFGDEIDNLRELSALTGADIVDLSRCSAGQQPVIGIGHIPHIGKITDDGQISGFNFAFRFSALSDPDDSGQEAGDDKPAVLPRTDMVEGTGHDDLHTEGIRIDFGQLFLSHPGDRVWADRTQGLIFPDGEASRRHGAIFLGRADGQNPAFRGCFPGRVQQVQEDIAVIPKAFLRMLPAVGHTAESRQVQDIIRSDFPEQRRQPIPIHQVRLKKLHLHPIPVVTPVKNRRSQTDAIHLKIRMMLIQVFHEMAGNKPGESGNHQPAHDGFLSMKIHKHFHRFMIYQGGRVVKQLTFIRRGHKLEKTETRGREMNHFGLVMAGGGGVRFWPLSRKSMPKQLLNLTGKDIMVNEAVDRLATVIGKSHLMIITSEQQTAAIIRATEGRVYPRNILTEPEARDTAACIGYAALWICKKYGDGVMVITPSDHYVRDEERLSEAFRLALTAAEEQDKLVTIGIRPTFPATGYGYIRSGGEGPVREVLSFREKPDEETAKECLASGDYVWNGGIFIAKAGLILRKIKAFAPDIYENLETIGEAMNTPREQDALHEVYAKIRSISFDYAVMEPAAAENSVLIIPCDCGWNDVGSWNTMDALHDPDEQGNVCVGDVLTINSRNSVIYSSGRNITAVDVENIVVVETADAVLVCRKDKAQNVRQIAEKLAETGRKDLT